MSAVTEHALENRLLSALPKEVFERLRPHLTPTALPVYEPIFEPDEPIRQVYFPARGTVSIVTVLEDGSTSELSVVGNEGMVGLSVALGVEVMANRLAFVQIAGSGLLLKSPIFKKEFQKSPEFHDLILRYTHAYITQIAQSAACNQLHHLEQRLARWLLSCRERMKSDELHLTQELIAIMIGARRPSVTDAASSLQKAGLIRYSRGVIVILDRAGLERAACECYAVVRREYERLYA